MSPLLSRRSCTDSLGELCPCVPLLVLRLIFPLRVSSDYNPLHIDPSIGSKLGFGGTILHGLCSYGIAARAIVKHVAGGDGTRLLEMGESESSRCTACWGPALIRGALQAVASRVPSSLDRRL